MGVGRLCAAIVFNAGSARLHTATLFDPACDSPYFDRLSETLFALLVVAAAHVESRIYTATLVLNSHMRVG